ncbi:hypothetical protein [Effusibacillus dendaii]|uniref:Uncharacterized protein n=1 Tax=Effusibacillus dendaii TaxID=2743772 RepID=A0A7I8D8W7_9BACL|nr:hypothetical protein [Effusibacillus dendaii]BCJ86583.1 hypothetical protein skT53_15680 [Effusibacillus dendaii]
MTESRYSQIEEIQIQVPVITGEMHVLLRTLYVEAVIPEYSAAGQPVAYRLYTRSLSGWRYDYCLIHATNREMIENLLARYQVERLEELQGVGIEGFIDGNRLVRLADYREASRLTNASKTG